MRIGLVLLSFAIAVPAAAYPDMSLIRRAIRVQIPEVRKCYEAELKRNPKAEGTVMAKLVIDGTGKVTESTATGFPRVETCVAAKLRKVQFPPNPKGTTVVNYPFAFRPRV